MPDTDAESRPDVVIRHAPPGTRPSEDGDLTATTRCYAPCHQGEIVRRISHGPGGTWLWNRSVGICHVHPDGQQVDVYPDLDANQDLLAVILMGQAMVFALHKQGYPVLHASAVLTERGAVAFTGPSGQGKSTMLASFLQRGATLLTDDALCLHSREDRILAAPSLPLMKLWPNTLECTLGSAEVLPSIVPNSPKRLLAVNGRYPFATQLAPLVAIYLLARQDRTAPDSTSCSAEALSPQVAVRLLIEQTSFGPYVAPVDAARLLPGYARLLKHTPVRVLRFPSGFEHQDDVHDWILRDLAEVRRVA